MLKKQARLEAEEQWDLHIDPLLQQQLLSCSVPASPPPRSSTAACSQPLSRGTSWPAAPLIQPGTRTAQGQEELAAKDIFKLQ